jgi:Holliday junction resolvase RusA-like endonuclease
MWYKSTKGNAWQEEALWELKRQAKGHSVKNDFDTVYITYCYNDKRRRDIDNGIKLTLDILVKAGLLKDDSQITFLQVQKTIGKKSYCMIELL